MSLRVWLPLLGNLDNKGSSDLTFSILASNTTVDNAGKLGKCYTNNITSGGGLRSDKTILLGQNQSMFCWFKFTSLNSSSNLGGGLVSQHRYPSNCGMGITIRYVSSTTGYLSVNTGNGSSRTYNEYYHPTLLQANTWYHGGYTYDGSNIRLYLNGSLGKTQAYTGMSVPADYLTVFCWSMSATSGNGVYGGYTLNGSINDVRVYDHCLSTSEIKEISKGLVLHYKLDDPIGFTDLIARNSGYSLYNNFGNNMPCTLTDTGTFFAGDKVYRGTYTPKSSSLSSIQTVLHSHGVYGWSRTFKASTKYVFWIYFKPISHTDIRVGGTASNIGGWIEIPPVYAGNGWYKVGQYRDGSVTSDKSDSVFVSFYCPSAAVDVPIIIDWASPHTVEGRTDIPDSDVPGPTVLDSSGNGYHGTYISGIAYERPSPRYDSCLHIGANTQYIKCASFPTSGFGSSYSFSWWSKQNTFSGTMNWGFADGIRLNGMYNGNLWNTGDGSNNPLYNPGTTTQVSAPSTGVWHHFVMTGDASTCKVYKDGVHWATAKTRTSISGTQIIINGWNTATDYSLSNYSCSDFRIYATCLTADDVKELYQTSAKIDNKGKVHAFSCNENSKKKVKKTGPVDINVALDNTSLSLLKYDTNFYVEPDGSVWVRVVHHAKCSTKLFASNNDFANSVYIDADRWFNMQVANSLDKWEIMVKACYTQSSTEYKFRWIQTKNPMTAAYADVASSAVTKITTAGYSTYSWGGLYHHGSNTYLCANNGTNGNWWGAVGSWAYHQGGIPGWTSVITTGYEDVYLRIDNVTLTKATKTELKKSGVLIAADFIEK